jgi:hypothetical protein
MAPRYNKTWTEQSPEERIETLRMEIRGFIDFFNSSVTQRNASRDSIVARIEALEKDVRRIKARLDIPD